MAARCVSPANASARTRPWMLLLVVTILVAYLPGLRAPFVFDDAVAVVHNRTIRHLDSLAIFRPPADGSTTTGRPLVNASYAVNYALSGDKPWSYHAVNVALHAFSALAFFGLVRGTLRRLREPGFTAHAATQMAAAAAGGWALHPLNTEAVVCIAQRTEVLSALCYLLTLYFFVRWVDAESPSRGWMTLSLVACASGMAAKEVMVTAPLVVLLYDRTFVAGSFRAAWQLRRHYHLLLGATWLLLAALVWANHGARGTSAGFGLGVTAWQYLLTQSGAIIRYLGLCLWPHPLVLDYGTRVARSAADVAPQMMLVAVLVAVTGWALWRRPRLGFVGAAFFGILAPSSSVIPLVGQTIAEHRMYLPLAAMMAGVVVLVARGGARRWGPPALAAVAALAIVTRARVQVYGDELALWRDNVASYPSSARAHANLAQLWQQRGAEAAADPEFAAALSLDPSYVTAHYDWGVALLQRGRLAEAEQQLAEAVRLAPGHADAQLNLGTVLLRLGQPSRALVHLTAALQIAPAADAYYDVGLALRRVGREREAAEHFLAAVRLNPQFAPAQEQFRAALAEANRAAVAQARRGELAAAASQLLEILRLQPRDADAHANLGNVLVLQNRPREALFEFQAAAILRPDDPRLSEAVQSLQQGAR